VLWKSIQNKITRKIIIFYLGGWKARGIPKGSFGRVLARKAKNGEVFVGWKHRPKLLRNTGVYKTLTKPGGTD
jgi:hypothetical protein